MNKKISKGKVSSGKTSMAELFGMAKEFSSIIAQQKSNGITLVESKHSIRPVLIGHLLYLPTCLFEKLKSAKDSDSIEKILKDIVIVDPKYGEKKVK